MPTNSRRAPKPVGRQRGLALVIVIWILTLLTLMAGSFAIGMRRESSISHAITANASASAMAESGIRLAEFNLLSDDPEQRWRGNGAIYQVIRPDSRMRIRIFSEAGKVDINTSNDAQLEAVLKSVLPDDWQRQHLLNAILDWRDADDDTRTQGAEKRQYKLAGLSYGPGNGPFQSLEELQLVLGMNEAIFEAIRPYITVYSSAAEVDPRQATPELLGILAADLKDRNVQDMALNGMGGSADVGGGFAGDNQTYTISVDVEMGQDAHAGLEAVVQSQGGDSATAFETLDWKANLITSSLFNPTMEYSVITIQDEFRYDDRF
ncbi:general secretion pathway protein GspK [Methylomonas sp. SURF-2]|uniref:General secretion pathway protein GspK n=1 Tax=Methylomonas subterranea TaxID=2952225 RepID=A0ABT1THV9_9GAMM|nr:type II secretion system protein GspK [Methylomonas sp. SURF-2]MCQ8105037.1 general secretion pathway protein GspK [Methylomonas sp. SURF-2]